MSRDDGAPLACRGYRVRGRVQGVGFRWWTRRIAEELGVGGSVRNLADGSVEVHACGSAEAVERLGALLRAGPPGARVDRVDSVDPDPGMPAAGFRIEL